MLKRTANWLAELLIQATCLLFGHEPMKEHGAAEVFLRCDRCGRRSAGWQLAPAKRPAPVLAAARPPTEDEREARLIQLIDPTNPPNDLDDQTAQLIGELDLAGEHEAVRLLLTPTSGVH